MKHLRRFEANMTLLGGVFATDKTATLVADLEPGSYWALDVAGQDNKFFAFTVSGVDTGNTMPTAPTLKAKKATTWPGCPSPFPQGSLTLRTSAGTTTDRAGQQKKGKTYQDFRPRSPPSKRAEAGRSPSPSCLSLDSGILSSGHSAVFNYRLPKGNYVMFCFWPDASMGGMEHAFMGMHRPDHLEVK